MNLIGLFSRLGFYRKHPPKPTSTPKRTKHRIKNRAFPKIKKGDIMTQPTKVAHACGLIGAMTQGERIETLAYLVGCMGAEPKRKVMGLCDLCHANIYDDEYVTSRRVVLCDTCDERFTPLPF